MKPGERGAADRGTRVRPRRARAVVVPVLLATGASVASLGATTASGDHLNLFQMVARAGIVASVRIVDGDNRYALADIQELVKGATEFKRLRIAFRDFNWSRRPGEPMIVFSEGEQDLLFLVPYMEVKRTEKNQDIFTLFRGRSGRIVLAPEGQDPHLEAVRHLARIAVLDAASQVTALKDLIGSPNPALRAAGMHEVARLRAVDPTLYAPLTGALFSGDPATRVDALDLVALMFSMFGAGEGLLSDDQSGRIALARVMELARNDREAAVRGAAVVALAAWPERSGTASDLRAIASQDPDQTVRLAAQRALLDGRE
jgi:hypothetical protein